MATYSTAQATAGQPRSLESGLQYKIAGPLGTNGGTISAGDVFAMIPVPHGAIVIGVDVWGQIPGVSAGTQLGVGDGASTSRYGAVSMSATAQFIRAPMSSTGPYQYSLSDDLVPRFDTIDLTVLSVASTTVTASLYVGVAYYMAPL